MWYFLLTLKHIHDSIYAYKKGVFLLKLCRFTTYLILFALLCACSSSIEPPRESLPPETVREDATGYVVHSPMAYPDYTFSSQPSVQTLRLTAVKATRDLLSIQWSTAKDIGYLKSGPINNKHFQHKADTTFAGTPYSNGSTGIFQFFEYYDSETGRFWYPGTGNELGRNLGNSCADSVIWGYNTVCTSLSGSYYPATMVQKNGYFPVGYWSYDVNINSFNKLPTYTIIDQHRIDDIMNSYAMVLPGDALVSTSDNHAMMAIEAAHLVQNEDGSLNTAESYVMIQDQRGGLGAGFYEQDENGVLLLYSGRTSAKFTFDELYNKHYLPVAPAEFLGQKEYEVAYVSASKENCTSLEELGNVTVKSNYPLAVLNVIVKDSYGNSTVIEKKLFSGANDGPPKEFELRQLESLKSYNELGYPKGGCTVDIEIVVSTGERFIPVSLKF